MPKPIVRRTLWTAALNLNWGSIMQSSTSAKKHLQRRQLRDSKDSFASVNSNPNVTDAADNKRIGATPFARTTKGMTPSNLTVSMRLLVTITAVVFCAILGMLVTLYTLPSSNLLSSTLCRRSASSSTINGKEDSLPVLDHLTEQSADTHRPLSWVGLTHLVMVAGHAIYVGESLSNDHATLVDESNWILESFQRGQVSTFVRHIERGVSLTANDSSALLLFSGGQTRQGAGPRSEALSYWAVANAAKWFGYSHKAVHNRSFAEEYARDSFENLLFSICRFRQITGRYPREISVVGFEFKRDRFVSIHRRALRYPVHRFHYIGVDPKDAGHSRAVRERAAAHGPYSSDPYGCNKRILREKREERNPYIRFHPYPQGCPEIRALFSYCRRSIYPGALPWDPRILRSVRESKQNDGNDLSESDSASPRL